MITPRALLAESVFDLRGPQFLALYAGCMLAAALVLAVVKRLVDPTQGQPPPPLPEQIDPRELAWLRGGLGELVRLTGFDLLQRGYAQMSGSSTLRCHPSPPPKRHLPPPALAMLELLKDSPNAATLMLKTGHAFAGETEALEERAKDRGLLTSERTREQWSRIVWGVALGLFVLAAAKVWIGLSRGHTNVGFLVILGIAGPLLLTKMRHLSRLSARGRAYLEQAQMALGDLKARAGSLTSSPMLLLAVGAFGMETLVSTSYASYPEYYGKLKRPVHSGSSCGSTASSCGSCSSGSSGSSGSSSSSCSSGSSSGCGGGCGGGGCGGCGS